MKILLVDAFNLIRRIYEARTHSSDLVSKADMESIILASKQSLARALRQHAVSHACVVFDSHDETWRHKLYPDYKGDRKPTPEPLINNLPLFEEAFTELGLMSLTVAGYEADDVIATLAQGIVDNVPSAQVRILSTDKGFLTMLSPELKVCNHFTETELSAYEISEKYGVNFWQLTDYWALAGDTSNHIKGIPKIGKKTAVTLLKKYETLETILATDNPEAPVQRIQADAELARMCRSLVTLKTDIELGINLKDMRIKK